MAGFRGASSPQTWIRGPPCSCSPASYCESSRPITVASLPAARWAVTAGTGGVPGGHPRSRGLPAAQGLTGHHRGGRWLRG